MTAFTRTLVVLLLFLNLPLAAAELAQRLDAIVAKHFKDGEPGAAVLVSKAGTPLLRKGYGMADLEQGTKIAPDSVFRLGSITKQFTAVAVLQLLESGRIALNDPITKYLPDVQTHGKTITIEHLLTHTSGLKSYTGKDGFSKRIAEDMTPKQIAELTREDPMQFDPGTKWEYNNTGYILLGMLVENVSGMPYAEYLEKNVYPRAGLKSTRYGDNRPIVPGRVPGYSRTAGKFVNAQYLSMTIPYAAGSLLSNVDDLATWTAAVNAGKVVDRRLIEKAWTPYRLTNGDDTGYGYGWRMSKLAGERVIEHGGGIHGYSTHAMWLPEHDLFVAVLSNDQTSDPDFVAGLLALEAAGKSWHTAEISMKPEELAAYAGVYRVDEKTRRTVLVEDGKLHSQRDGGPRLELFPIAKDQFRFRGSFSSLTFERDAAGNVSAMVLDSGSTTSRAPKTGEKPAERATITIDPAKLDRYVGKYEVGPGAILTIVKKDGGLAGIANSGSEVQLFPASETTWFAKTVGVELVFTFDEKGIANGLTMNQGGRPRVMKKLE